MADEKQPITVWHVEDERQWQGIVERGLAKAGYQVHLTVSAREALGMIPNQVKEFPVAVLDGNLGDGTGEMIANSLRSNQLPIGIIGLSYDDEMLWADIGLSKSSFKRAELLSAVARLLTSD